MIFQEAACTWYAQEQAVVSSGAGSAKRHGQETAWGIIGSARI